MRETLKGFEQPFEEASWRKMELLLDKEKEPKRPLGWLWWLLPGLLLVGASVFFYRQQNSSLPRSSDDAVAAAPKGPAPVKISAVTKNFNTNPIAKAQPRLNVLSPKIGSATTYRQAIKAANGNFGVTSTPITQGQRSSAPLDKSSQEVENPSTIAVKEAQDPYHGAGRLRSTITAGEFVTETIPGQGMPGEKLATAVSTGSKALDTSAQLATTLDNKRGLPKARADKQKSHASRLYLIAVGGAESSGTSASKLDKVTPRAGLVIGYQLGSRMSLQTGFFTSHKKYVAGPSDYYAKSGTYWSTVDITSVKANCLVYEIPFNLRFDFHPSSKSFRIFTLAGLSSYIMKKEDYQYTYKRYGYTNTAAATYSGNQHLFSVLRVGGGIEKQISESFSFHASPAISIPLAGVGEGAVKLYSTDILLGVRYNLLKNQRKP